MGSQVDTLKRAWRRVPTPVRKKIRKQLPKNLIKRFAGDMPEKKAIQPDATSPLLSVIVPVYNVEPYLAPCLESISAQKYKNLEILVIDDGSTDGSLAIAEKFACSDPRFRIIRQQNAGLGAARNTGIREAVGTYLAFADSDDLVPPHAYSTMMESLNSSGSDFAVGSLNRLIGNRREVPAWAKKVHIKDRIGIQIDEFPEILQDVFAWNKVFKASFWDEHIGAFPEGILYEDQQPTARAYLLSTGFDVLSAVVYDWRIREDRSSITQNKDDIRDLKDRLEVCIRTREFLDTHASAEVLRSWLWKVLGPDLGQYYAQVPRTGDEYWAALRQGLPRIVPELTSDLFQGLEVNHRIMVHLMLVGNRADVVRVAVHQSEHGSKYPITCRSAQLYAQPAYLDSLDTKIPDPILEIRSDDLQINSRITSIVETSPRKVTISGFAYIEGLRTDPSTQVRAHLVHTVTNDSVELVTKMVDGVDVDNIANDPWTSYENSCFEIEFDLDRALSEGLKSDPNTEWTLRLTVTQNSYTASGIVRSRDMSGTAATLPLLGVQDAARHIFRFSRELGLSLLPVSYKRFAIDGNVVGRTIELRVQLPQEETPHSLRLECPSAKITRDFQPLDLEDPYSFRFVLPSIPTELPTSQVRWKLRVGTTDGKHHHIAWPLTRASLNHGDPANSGCVRLATTGYGYLEVFDRPWQITANAAEVSSDTRSVTVRGTATFADASPARTYLPKLVLANEHISIAPDSIASFGDNGFVAIFPMSDQGGASTRESSLYTLRAQTSDTVPEENQYWVPVGPELEKTLPREVTGEEMRIRLGRTPKAAALAVTVSPPFMPHERGKVRQTRLQSRIPSLVRSPIVENSVLFETFSGTGIADSGLGLFNEMMRRNEIGPKYWSVKDASIPVPEGSERLIRYTEKWYEVLHTAEFVVNNANFPFFYRKNANQKYVQTWHGTPLKRIGNDIPSSTLSLAYMSLMKREANAWDFLIAQNDFAARVLPAAFDYNGPVLNLGYPRNDALTGIASTERRAAVRKVLGLSPSQKAVLYAPTWRDNVRSFNNRYMLADFLNYTIAGEILGPDYVFLLRGHTNVSSGRGKPVHPGVIDVTDHPNINDLMLAADVLVTDYSSVMFDFCVTNKPIYFLAPDLEEYRDKVRGFYFDFEDVAPGPICRDTDSLAAAIRDNVSEHSFRDKYCSFKEMFAPNDDGHASERVYEAIWKNQ